MTHFTHNRAAGKIDKPQGGTVSDLDVFRRPHSHARRFAPERTALLPGLNDLYRAAEFADSEINRLVLVMGKNSSRFSGTAYVFLQYMCIGIGELAFTAEGQVFHFVYTDIQSKLVTVYGRNLECIADSISLRRLHWIRQADGDFRAPACSDEPIITKIEIRDWRPEDSQTDNAVAFAD